MPITCDNLEDIFKDDDGVLAVTPKLVDHFRKRLASIEADKTLSPEAKATAVEGVIKHIVSAKKKAGVQAIETAVKNLVIHRTMKEVIERKIAPIEVAYSIVDKSNEVFTGSRDGAHSRKQVLLTKQQNALMQDMAANNLMDYIKGDRDLYVEKATNGLVKKLSDDEIIKAYGVTKGDIATSRMYMRAMATSLEQLRAAGVEVSAREGYLGRQTFDREKIELDKNGFRKDMIDNIDWEKTNQEIAQMRAEGDADVAIKYNEFFETFELDEATINKKMIGGSAIKYGKQRKIIYKEGSGVLMMKKYGYADTLFGNILGTVDDVAKRVAIHEKLGHNPRGAYQSMLDRYVPSAQHDKAMAVFDKYMGHVTPAEVWAQRLGDLRATGSLLMLTNSTFTAVATDYPAAVAALVQTGAAKNVFEGTLMATREYFANISPKRRKMVALEMQSKLIHEQNSLHKYIMDGPRGKLSTALSVLFKANGLEYHTKMGGLATAKIWADKMLYQVKNNAIDPKMRRLLLTHGIGDMELKAISKIEGLTFSVDKLHNLDMTKIDRPAHLTAERFRTQIEHKLVSALNDMSDIGTQTPSIRENVMLGGATNPNTMEGQLTRFGTQFMPTMLKGYYDIGFLSKVAGYGKYGKSVAIGARLAGVTVTGYTVMMLRDIIYDRELTNPEDIGVDDFARWIQLSGVTGMWGDSILGSIAYNGAELKDAAVGPTIGLISDNTTRVFRKIGKYLKGDDIEFSESDMKAAVKMIPLAGIPMIMGPMTHAINMLGD